MSKCSCVIAVVLALAAGRASADHFVCEVKLSAPTREGELARVTGDLKVTNASEKDVAAVVASLGTPAGDRVGSTPLGALARGQGADAKLDIVLPAPEAEKLVATPPTCVIDYEESGTKKVEVVGATTPRR